MKWGIFKNKLSLFQLSLSDILLGLILFNCPKVENYLEKDKLVLRGSILACHTVLHKYRHTVTMNIDRGSRFLIGTGT